MTRHRTDTSAAAYAGNHRRYATIVTPLSSESACATGMATKALYAMIAANTAPPPPSNFFIALPI